MRRRQKRWGSFPPSHARMNLGVLPGCRGSQKKQTEERSSFLRVFFLKGTNRGTVEVFMRVFFFHNPYHPREQFVAAATATAAAATAVVAKAAASRDNASYQYAELMKVAKHPRARFLYQVDLNSSITTLGNPFSTGNPFWGTKLRGFSIGRGLGALKGLTAVTAKTTPY